MPRHTGTIMCNLIWHFWCRKSVHAIYCIGCSYRFTAGLGRRHDFRATLDNPEFGCELQPIDFVAFARACGRGGSTIYQPATCCEILDENLTVRCPTLIESAGRPS